MKHLRYRIYSLLFRTLSKSGKTFNVALLLLIVISVLLVLLESVKPLSSQYPDFFYTTEWIFTIIFTLEYLLRVYAHPKPWKYMTSFIGVIDLLAILPTYLGLIFDQTTFLFTVRAFRLLRMFRILKLTRYISEADLLKAALKQSFRKIIVFFEVVLVLVLFLGTIMYLVEGEHSGFTSIPQSIYWAIVTITTVGYGDIAPVTAVGKLIASVAMLTGYSIIAVPTGLITVEIGRISSRRRTAENEKICPKCGHTTADVNSIYCSRCATLLSSDQK